MDYLTGLLRRRSVAPKEMDGDAIDPRLVEQMLSLAVRTPDHGKLAPWRLVVLDKPAQTRFSELVVQRFCDLNPEAEEALVRFERTRIARAPLVVAVLSTPQDGKIPLWEQQLSAGAVCMNLLHAAHALGYGGKWLTEWIAYDPVILAALGGGEGDRVAGFVYLGRAACVPEERARPALEDVVRTPHWPVDSAP